MTAEFRLVKVTQHMAQTYPIVLRAPDGSTLRLERFPVVIGRAVPGAPSQPDCDVTPFDREGLAQAAGCLVPSTGR